MLIYPNPRCFGVIIAAYYASYAPHHCLSYLAYPRWLYTSTYRPVTYIYTQNKSDIEYHLENRLVSVVQAFFLLGFEETMQTKQHKIYIRKQLISNW